MRVLGLDVGDRRIGLAISDPSQVLAQPMGVISRGEVSSDIQELLEIAKRWDVGQLIVGIPVSLDGKERKQAQIIRGFCRLLQSSTELPVETMDERYTTVQAQRLLRQAGHRPSEDKGSIDAAAAAILLQAHLDALLDQTSE